jgi:acyl-coenzyme A synthetase/AMP-(fatty) acid ligase
MAAVISANQCNLLPPNRQKATLQTLSDQYPDSYVIHDGHEAELPDYIQTINIRQLAEALSTSAQLSTESPLIEDTQLAAISFTSGSTGQSKPNEKTWKMLRVGMDINIENMLFQDSAGLNMLATVPPQHMYGFELSILIPMAADICSYSGQPLFPADVQQALYRMPAPRCLVSTPQHLKALLRSELEFPPVERVFSATAPLDRELAKEVERYFGASLIEIYGCSEVGSIARRQTARDDNWQPFSAMTVETIEDRSVVRAPHLEVEYELQDSIAIQADGSFSLRGRLSDLINIAGKRGSLTQINEHLLAIPEVEDGVIFDPERNSGSDGIQRLAAIVVGNNIDKNCVLAALRENLDPAFLPRPILFTQSLPRAETGKLQRQLVLDLFERLRDQRLADKDLKAANLQSVDSMQE